MIELDRDAANADWTKTRWDIPATNPDELYVFIAQHGLTVAQFKKLPVYKANIAEHAWLRDIAQPSVPGTMRS